MNKLELRVAAVLHVAAAALQGPAPSTARSSASPRLMPSVTSMRIGTPRSRSNCVCRRNFASSFAARGSAVPAWTSTGRPFSSVPSTSVTVCCTSFSRGSRAMGWSCSPSSAMISFSRSGWKTSVASLSEPSEARRQPSLRCTFRSCLACWMARNERTTGLNRNSSTSMQYWSKCNLRLPALSRWQADLVQARQERRELVEVLQARHVFFAHVFAFLPAMPRIMRASAKTRNTTCVGCVRMRKSRAEQDWDCPYYKKRPFNGKGATSPQVDGSAVQGDDAMLCEDRNVRIEWFRKAALEGHRGATPAIAHECHDPRNRTRWLRIAAENDFDPAAYEFAITCENLDERERWLLEADENGWRSSFMAL